MWFNNKRRVARVRGGVRAQHYPTRQQLQLHFEKENTISEEQQTIV